MLSESLFGTNITKSCESFAMAALLITLHGDLTDYELRMLVLLFSPANSRIART